MTANIHVCSHTTITNNTTQYNGVTSEFFPSVCFLSVLKDSGKITPSEEEISCSGMREVQQSGIHCDHLGDIYKMKQLLYTSATYRSITAHVHHLCPDL